MEAANIILTILTGIYAVLTYFIMRANHAAVDAMRAQVAATTRPYVHFDMVTKGALIELVLKNTGASGAFDVKVDITPKLEAILRGRKEPACLVSFPISMLSSGRELRECICSIDELKKQSPELTFIGTVSYKDASDQSFTEPFRMNLSALIDMCYIMRPDSAEELKKIAEELHGLKEAIKDGFRQREIR